MIPHVNSPTALSLPPNGRPQAILYFLFGYRKNHGLPALSLYVHFGRPFPFESLFDLFDMLFCDLYVHFITFCGVMQDDYSSKTISKCAGEVLQPRAGQTKRGALERVVGDLPL